MRHRFIIEIVAFCWLMATPAGALEIKVGSLAGELCLPEKTISGAVVIIPGSGPINRDGDSMHMNSNMYRQIAEGLADEGLASVRIDKRGMFRSASPGIDPNNVTLSLYANDAHAWAKRLREETGSECAWILGHSEGGLVALLAAKNPDDICGIIAAATPGRKMGDLLREQLKANPANSPLLPKAFELIEKLEAGNRIPEAEIPPILMSLFSPSVQGFLIDLMHFEPSKAAASLQVPLLIIQGTGDIQVTKDDAERLHAANIKSKLVLLNEVSHTLKSIPAGQNGLMRTYMEPNIPLAEGLITAIATYILNERE